MPLPPASKRFALLAAALVLMAGSSLRAQGPGGLPDPRDRELLFRPHSLPPQLLRPPSAHGLQDDYDVLRYDLSVWLDVPNAGVEGRVEIDFDPLADPFDRLELDLHSPNMEVLSIQVLEPPGVAASFEHVDDKLTITFDPPLQGLVAPARVAVGYQGNPRQLSFGTLTFSTHGDPPAPLIYSLAEPDLARGWWPCKDRPDDKALVTMHVEAPDDLVVVSNGLQLSAVPGRAGQLVTTWSSRYPITTYLVSIAVSDYASWTDDYQTMHPVSGDPISMPITHWSWPEKEAAAREDWSVTLPMMEYYSSIFGEYPFVEEKYGHGMARLSGAMEHQTATTYGAALVTGDHRFDFVVAHELAHQWWGDLVSPTDFDSIWLNEGFASWSEALWFEQRDGFDRYRDYMTRTLRPRNSEFPGTVHQPDGLFNDTVYHKGAWVLHMLRWVLGQPTPRPDAEAVLEQLRAWSRERAHADGSTADFERLVSDGVGPLFGAPLDQWFFPEWVHREGRPSYQVGWTAAALPGGTYRVYLRVKQVQGGDPFLMPVPVRIVLPSGPVEEVVWNDSLTADYEWEVAEAPLSLSWDEDSWILKWSEPFEIDGDDDGWPEWIDGCPDVPNPDQEDLNGNGIQDACEAGLDFDGDGILNEADCAPADAEVWSQPAGETLLFVSREAGGAPVLIRFEHPDPLSQRAYSSNVARGDLLAAREAGGAFDAGCIGTSGAGDAFVDDLPGEALYYLARPVNGCTADPGAPGSADPCR